MRFSLSRRLTLLICGGMLLLSLLAGVIIQDETGNPSIPTLGA